MYKQFFNIAIYKLTPLIIYVWLQTFNQNLFLNPLPPERLTLTFHAVIITFKFTLVLNLSYNLGVTTPSKIKPGVTQINGLSLLNKFNLFVGTEADKFLKTKLDRLSTILLKGSNKSESKRNSIQKPVANFDSEKAVCGSEGVSLCTLLNTRVTPR